MGLFLYWRNGPFFNANENDPLEQIVSVEERGNDCCRDVSSLAQTAQAQMQVGGQMWMVVASGNSFLNL